MSYKHGWNDPSNSGFHSQAEKDGNRKLRDEIDALSKNYTGTDGWAAGQSYANGVYGGGKYKDNLMNDEYLGHMIGYLKSNQKEAAAAQKEEKEEPIQLSETVATAIGRAKAYQDTLAIRDGDYTIGGDESVLDDFRTQSKANIAEAMKPGYYDSKLKLQKTV